MVRDGTDRHARRGHHRHAGPAHGQARPGPGVPRRRHRPRRPLLHVPPRHGHGDEHAGGLPADELGDRLRRLDRRRRSGTRCASCPGSRRRRIVLADTIDEETHQEIPVSPRTILKRQVDRAAAAGLHRQGRLGVRVLRPQGHLGRDRRATAAPVPKRFGHYNEDYHLLQATKAEPLHRLLRNQMTEARIPIEFSKGEAAPGQHEVNIRYDHVLESADRSVLFKHGAKEIAYLNGWGITFMAKPDHTWTGSSGHLHMSVWDEDGDALADLRPDGDGRPYGMSETMQPLHGRDDEARRASWRSSSPRSSTRTSATRRCRGRRSTSSGAATTGRPGSGSSATAQPPRRGPLPGRRHECVPDVRGDVGAGLYGIEHKLEPPDEYKGNGYIATGVRADAAGAVRGDPRARGVEAAVEIFGEDVVDHYLNAARVEQDAVRRGRPQLGPRALPRTEPVDRFDQPG